MHVSLATVLAVLLVAAYFGDAQLVGVVRLLEVHHSQGLLPIVLFEHGEKGRKLHRHIARLEQLLERLEVHSLPMPGVIRAMVAKGARLLVLVNCGIPTDEKLLEVVEDMVVQLKQIPVFLHPENSRQVEIRH